LNGRRLNFEEKSDLFPRCDFLSRLLFLTSSVSTLELYNIASIANLFLFRLPVDDIILHIRVDLLRRTKVAAASTYTKLRKYDDSIVIK
jgi:hypothetical protein